MPNHCSPFGQTEPGIWFDGHLDLACIAMEGRDLSAPLSAAVGPPQPASITFSSLAEGGVIAALGTIFTGPGVSGPCGYPRIDGLVEACKAGRAQLAQYHRWEQEGLIRLVRSAADLPDQTKKPDGPIAICILMEGADPVTDPDDLPCWFEAGLRIIGMSWSHGTTYAGGNTPPYLPLTTRGERLVHAMDRLGMIHDVSHLSECATWQLLEVAQGPIMASHSNCRSLIREPDRYQQRHLPDDLIRALGERGAVIGVNLCTAFLESNETKRATITQVADHVEHVCQITRRVTATALGSDMDGGFGADRLPEGIDRPAHLHRIADELSQRGFSDEDVLAFRYGNWYSFLKANLPADRAHSDDAVQIGEAPAGAGGS